MPALVRRAVTVNIVNRNYPPYPGITGESAAELADFLSAQGLNVNAIHVDAPYQSAGMAKQPAGVSHRVSTFYNGKNKLLRLFGNLYEAIRLVRKSQSLKPDVTIYLTDPPFLSICAALLSGRRDKWMLWSMDLFPEGFSASHLVSVNNPLYRLLDSIVRRNPPHHVIALGEHQAEYVAGKFPHGVPFTILPCGIYAAEPGAPTASGPAWANAGTRTILGYCGNIGEAHSTEFLEAVIDNIDPEGQKLVLVLYGSRARTMLAYATGKPGVEIVTFVGRHELGYIDVHLASLNREWVNVCVPSKTVSSVCSGSAFLYYGIPESDNWSLLHDAGWMLTEDGSDLHQRVRDWLRDVGPTVAAKKENARRLAPSLLDKKRDAFRDIHRAILGMAAATR
ncbi:glycosyltransferase family 4 protein [soil metagenome]